MVLMLAANYDKNMTTNIYTGLYNVYLFGVALIEK